MSEISKTIKERLFSFKHAINGIFHLVKTEVNFRIHAFIAFIVIGWGWYSELTQTEWLLVIICIGSVLAAEAFNTAVENFCDFISPNNDPRIKIIKDTAAAAVLLISLMAAIIGVIIFC